LGGINEKNINEIFESEVDGVALLGAIWGNDEPLGVFKKYRQNVIY
jgi:thiamine-phosphate pyrophosphorylase